MITTEELITGKEDFLNIETKRANLQTLIDKVINPIEALGYEITVVRGLLNNTEVSDVKEPILRRDYIYGYGIDISVGDRNKELYEAIKKGEVIDTFVQFVNDSLHVRYSPKSEISLILNDNE